MRDMTPIASQPDRPAPRRPRRPGRLRPWVQAAFLLVWLPPLGQRWLHAVPGCVFHCYACPLSSLACPVGVVAQFSALHVFPLLAVGVVLAVAAMVGSLVCGWACPFGFLQDLLGKLPLPRLRIPNWLGYGRYLVLAATVLAVPFFLGEQHPLFICRTCPAGALEGGVGLMIQKALTGGRPQWPSPTLTIIAGTFLAAALVTYRPWCKVFCPLGGFLSLFNRVSLLHLRYDPHRCTECNLCRSRCHMGVHVEKRVNSAGCIRCLECTTCGAIALAAGTPGRTKAPADPQR